MRRLRLTSKEREKQVPIFSQEYGEKQEKAWWKKYRGRKWICLFGVNCLLVCLFIFFFVNSEVIVYSDIGRWTNLLPECHVY
jgi:hypothetical protein